MGKKEPESWQTMMMPFESGQQEWDDSISELEGVHFLQSWEWGKFKSENGWKVFRFIWFDKERKIKAAAQVLERNVEFFSINLNLKILYIPKGPLLSDWNHHHSYQEVISDLINYARK